jgi:transcriptional regulator with XRE-family HTH domain
MGRDYDAVDQLRSWIKARNLTQSRVAEALGVGQTTVSEWLLRRKVPGLRLADAIHKLTGINPGAWLRVARNTSPRVSRV